MNKITQTESGRAFEFALSEQFLSVLKGKATVRPNPSLTTAKNAFDLHSAQEQYWLNRMADEAANFLFYHDARIQDAQFLELQLDKKGQEGDVRDILLELPDGQRIGVSAKNRHEAVKHSRLSPHIDFARKWFDLSCSRAYFHEIRPIFQKLTEMRHAGLRWRDVEDKQNRFYVPLLKAFMEEMKRLYDAHGERVAKGLIAYLVGKQDFYKVIKENGNLSLQSFNLNGSLEWGNKWKLPMEMERIAFKRGSKTTIHLTLDGGYLISMRLHSAETKVIPSLKFDVQLIGMPSYITRHSIVVERV